MRKGRRRKPQIPCSLRRSQPDQVLRVGPNPSQPPNDSLLSDIAKAPRQESRQYTWLKLHGQSALFGNCFNYSSKFAFSELGFYLIANLYLLAVGDR